MFINLRKYRPLIMAMALAIAILGFYYKYHNREDNRKMPVPHETNFAYGAFLPWPEVNKLFPQYARATVIDFETGLQYRVQRRAGQYHADVQPLTAVDTATMKQIYQGKWTWRRRAVIVQLDNGQRIAASINGMPHGQGAIQGNNFNGHSCIHFRGSKTHASGKTDPAHQMMIWKAANVLQQQLQSLSHDGIIRIFFAAVEQGDTRIMKTILVPGSYTDGFMDSITGINYLKVKNIKKITGDNYSVDIQMALSGSTKIIHKKILVTTMQIDGNTKIDAQVIMQLLDDKLIDPTPDKDNIPDQEDEEY